MRLEGKKVCVTGAAGFLGRHLSASLLAQGAEVIALDNFEIGSQDAFNGSQKGLTVCNADIRDIDSIKDALAQADVVYHLAAIANPRTCQRDFPLAFDVNIKGTENVLDASHHVERIVFLSSIMVYGEPRYLPIDDRHPLDGRDPYAASKKISEELVKICGEIHKVPFTIVRNSNSFGPFQSSDYLIPTLIGQGLNDGEIEIWDPRTVRDFLFVDDTVGALVSIVESEAATGETVNLGSGLGVSAGELADYISAKLGVAWVDAKKPAAVSSKLIADTNKVKALTGWRQQVSLEEGLDRTIEYFQSVAAKK